MSDNTSATQLNLQLRLNKLASPQLVQDYYDGSSALAPFFAGFPWDIAAYRRVAARVKGQFGPEARRAMAAALQPTTEGARAKLETIANGDGFFVTTGQQAGLFSGPLFTVYKTLTTIKLAACLERDLGVPVAPVFWIAADDHDFAEVNHTFLFGMDNDVHRVEIEPDSTSTQSMNRHPLGDDVLAAIDQVQTLLPDNEFTQEIVGWLRAAYVPGQSVAQAFAQLIERMFSAHDLLVTSSAHPVVKRIGASVIAHELENSEKHERAVGGQTDKLVAAGYHEQVTVREGAANVLYEDDDGRDRLTREGDDWLLSRTKRRMKTSDLRALLQSEPQRFSANVLLRPVLASAVFPTLAYVGGPAEVSYFAQIGCLFEAHDVAMPLVMPRASLAIVEHKIQKVLDKFALDVDVFRQPFDQLASQVARDELPATVSDPVALLREQITEGYSALVEASDAIDPTLRGPLENARNMSLKALGDAEKKVVSHLKKRNDTGLEQLRKASTNLYPERAPQERVITALSYIARYGPAFLDAVATEIAFAFDATAPEWQGVNCNDNLRS